MMETLFTIVVTRRTFDFDGRFVMDGRYVTANVGRVPALTVLPPENPDCRVAVEANERVNAV